jgi:hypothetical protein
VSIRTRVCLLAGAAGALFVAASTAVSQPESAPPPPAPAEDAGTAEPARRPMVRARLERRLDEVEREKARLEEAIAAIDRGETPRDIWQALRPRPDGQVDRPLRPVRPSPKPQGGPPFDRPAVPDELRDTAERGPRGEGRGEGDVRLFVRDRLPRLDTLLEQMEERDPESARFLFERIAPRLREAMAVHAEDPELADLKLAELQASLDVLSAADAVRRIGPGAPEAELAPLRAELEAALGRQFDARAARTDVEIQRLRMRLAELERERSARVADRDEEIRTVADRMIRRATGGPRREGRPDDAPTDD